jgi:ATP adenylyltransferase/5',5'''-P-1,P-4-tetraphosphate phosphorylase II
LPGKSLTGSETSDTVAARLTKAIQPHPHQFSNEDVCNPKSTSTCSQAVQSCSSVWRLDVLRNASINSPMRRSSSMSLHFESSNTAANTTQFQLRFSPALANKPKSNKPSNSKPIDPFENPPKGLFITDLPPSHFLVLNKFPVIPNHFILATKPFKHQTDALELDDLEAAYACVRAYRDKGEELFGFFNSGEASGASQPHRHIQFLPVESMRSGLQESAKWDVLADSLVNTPKPGN